MSKKALIIAGVIGLVVIVIGLILIFGQKKPPTQTETQNEESVSVSSLASGWRLIKHPAFGVSLEVPSAWEITILENGRGKVEATFQGAGVNAVVDIVREDNVSGLTPEKLLDQGKSGRTAEISRGSVKGVSYVTKIGSEHEPELLSDSYLLINKYFVDNEILTISCGLSGPNYKTMVPTCEEIIGSLQFTN